MCILLCSLLLEAKPELASVQVRLVSWDFNTGLSLETWTAMAFCR